MWISGVLPWEIPHFPRLIKRWRWFHRHRRIWWLEHSLGLHHGFKSSWEAWQSTPEWFRNHWLDD